MRQIIDMGIIAYNLVPLKMEKMVVTMDGE